ncbi:MAG: S-methyl-5-thioribose-1-phosphate isomerase [Armatimonadetes bacterium]|nr:S-methyl-5-thioribose-1-phosphate isomerase [Armatimonadota bacterium]MDW8122356.1 S-methyl-5-thioribose-1-phosphate isomerase [Armatimonadota bacterium]
MAEVKALEWTGATLRLLDQRVLPDKVEWVTCHSADEVAEGIRNLVIRGAPAIGIAAAFGMVLAARKAFEKGTDLAEALTTAASILIGSRPTAVNLSWAVKRMLQVFNGLVDRVSQETISRLEAEALQIWEEDLQANRTMGQLGAELVPKGARILTHCNTGSLATGGHGTALGVIKSAYRQGKVQLVWVDETRPVLQGARLTMWECLQEGIPARLIADGAAAYLMQKGLVDLVIVGADRITANGDVANKIGTYMLAVAAAYHQIPFYVAAPASTLDISLPSGDHIPIEERSPDEVLGWKGVKVAPEGASAFNLAFDVTPNHLVSAIITERGIARPPYTQSLPGLFKSPQQVSVGNQRRG